MKENKLLEIFRKRGEKPSSLIEVLQDIQQTFSFLPEDALRLTAEKLKVPLIEVFRVANFYKAFSLTPRGKYLLTICIGTACHVRGASRLIDEASRLLDTKPGCTSEDGFFTLEAVNCLGACALGPVAVINGVYHDHVTPVKLKKIIADARAGNLKAAKTGSTSPSKTDGVKGKKTAVKNTLSQSAKKKPGTAKGKSPLLKKKTVPVKKTAVKKRGDFRWK
ncbi:MAG: hypothetical protein A2096_08390 [Spirochaetes bacterium GWF1_41_5]|nr:MAG: hypothetical protein A2096_08390 [Spirochaetes bacterium GWF1_41_5]HBE03216.1 hypothetical protein [Spirochaetia bacterium]